MKPTRRELMVMLAASACGRRPGPEPGPTAPEFPMGVAAGDAHDDSVLLWTVFEGEAPLMLRVWREEDVSDLQRLPAPVSTEGVVQVSVERLLPATWYSYVFEAADGAVRSDQGRFRTAPLAAALMPLTFGVTSCSRQNQPLTPLLRAAQDYTLDAFLYLGDTVYADGAVSREQYRLKWRSGLTRWPQRVLRASTSIIATLDDHEVDDDFGGDSFDPDQLANALAVFFEHQPLRTDAPDRIWRSLRWGKTAEVFVLDSRTERNRERGEYVSPEQMAWLKDGLSNSTAVFKLVMNSVPIGSFPGSGFQAFADDRWEGFPAQRDDLLRFIDDHVKGVLWLSGDFHMGIAGRVALSGVGATQVEIACGPAGSSFPNPAPSYPHGPQFDFASATNNVVVLDLDPITRGARVRFVAGDGRVLFDHTYVL